jgi:hypothetical protein
MEYLIETDTWDIVSEVILIQNDEETRQLQITFHYQKFQLTEINYMIHENNRSS